MPSSRTRRSKLLVLTSTFPRWPGDTDPSFVYELCCRLSETFQVHVLAPRAPGSRSAEEMGQIGITRYGYFFRRWENLAYQGGILAKLRQKRLRAALIPFFLLGQLSAALRLLRRGSFDCIHAHWLLPQGLVAAVALAVARKPAALIVTSHGSDLFGLPGAAFDRMRRQIVRQASAVTVVSDPMRKALQRSIPDAPRIEVISMGVDLKHVFVPSEGSVDYARILYVGRLMRSKGVEVLIRALPQISRLHPHIRLQVVGEGPDKETYRRLAERLAVKDRVEFSGALEKHRLPAVYRSASVLVFPSLQAEGFGLVPVEALGCGCAVVASDLPAVREVIRDQEYGLLVPPGDHRRLARAIVRLLEDPQLRSRLAAAGRRQALARFDWDLIAERYRTLLENVISNASPSRQHGNSAALIDGRQL